MDVLNDVYFESLVPLAKVIDPAGRRIQHDLTSGRHVTVLELSTGRRVAIVGQGELTDEEKAEVDNAIAAYTPF